MKDKDYLVSGNNDGFLIIWELVVSEDNQAKPYLLGVINNANNKYEDINTAFLNNVEII